MSSVSVMGSYSGITMDTVDQLIKAESGKLVQYSSQKTELTSEKNAWKDINTRLDSLHKKFEAVKETATFDSKKVTNSNTSVVTVTASTEALEGTYSVKVSKLATSSQLNSGKIAKMTDKKITDALELSGDLIITTADLTNTEEIDKTKKTVTIKVEPEDSLKDIVTKLNENAKENKSGLQASIIDNRIVLTDGDMGNRSIEVTESTVATNLALSDNTKENFTAGEAAALTINGILITRNSNTITDAVEGVTFNLLAVSENDKVSTVKVAEDFDKTTAAVQEFVDQYNSVMAFVGEQLAVGNPSSESNKTGALVGDSSLMRIQTQLRSLLTKPMKEDEKPLGPIRSLGDLGIEVDKQGKATLDTKILQEQLTKNSNDVQRFFYLEEPVLDDQGVKTGEINKHGIAHKMTTFINDYIGDKTGIITNRSKTIDSMLKDLDKQIAKFNERLETKRTRYIEQFTALDVAMMEAESQMSYLMSQIGAVTGNNK